MLPRNICPFCQSTQVQLVSFADTRWQLHCTACAAASSAFDTQDEATAAWREINETTFLLNAVLNESPHVTFVKNEAGEFLIANKQVAEYYNTTPDDLIGKTESAFNDNHEQVSFYLNSLKQILDSNQKQVVLQTSIEPATGKVRYFESTKIPIQTPQGDKRLLVIANDVTSLREAEETAQRGVERFAQAMAIAGEGFWEWDCVADTIDHNRKWSDIVGINDTAEQHSMSHFMGYIHAADKKVVAHKLRKACASDGSFTAEYRLCHPNGDVINVLDRGQVVERDENGQALRMLGAMVDITDFNVAKRQLEQATRDLSLANHALEEKVKQRTTELENANAELIRLAHRDALTELANRRAANERLKQEYERMLRNGNAYSVILLDVDYFKRVNDKYGHHEGDKALQHLSLLLKTAVRESDFVARFGGEEFLIMLPDTSVSDAYHVAEKCRVIVQDTSLCSNDYGDIALTISMGVACASIADNNEFIAVNLADEELYRAKRNGRNQVSVHNPDSPLSFGGRSA